MKMEYHNPVLLKESVDGLDIKPDGIYVDVTFGGGGHSREILSRLGSNGRLYAFDQDEDALANSIDDVLDSKGRLMLLYLTESENSGHWVCLLHYPNSNILEYFDPYGNYKPDGESKWLSAEKLKELGQSTKKLTQLLKRSHYEVKSNAFPFQIDKFNINTCGRHCTVRLYFKNLILPDYIKLVESTGLTPDDFVCAFTHNLIGK
jgi:hypothetical protein